MTATATVQAGTREPHAPTPGPRPSPITDTITDTALDHVISRWIVDHNGRLTLAWTTDAP